MKKLPGSSLPSLDMLPNLLWISTLHIQLSLVLCQVFDLGTFHSNLKSYLKFSPFYKSIQLYLLFYSFIVESWSSTLAPKLPSKPWAIIFRYPFCSLRSPLISTKAEETSCLQPPVPVFSDPTSNPTSTWLLFLGHNPTPPDRSCCFQLDTQIPLTVQTIFWAAQWSHNFCCTPSGSHMQYCACHWHQSQTWPLFVVGSSRCLSFKFQYQPKEV